ncbi:hypothetical protein V8D89_001540 [Ganoderma adspersum]
MASSASYQAVDAVVSSNFSIYSPSVSRPPASEHPSGPAHFSASETNGVNGQPPDWVSESEPLLGSSGSKGKPFYRPRPLWYVSTVSNAVQSRARVIIAARPTVRSLSRRVDIYHPRI